MHQHLHGQIRRQRKTNKQINQTVKIDWAQYQPPPWWSSRWWWWQRAPASPLSLSFLFPSTCRLQEGHYKKISSKTKSRATTQYTQTHIMQTHTVTHTNYNMERQTCMHSYTHKHLHTQTHHMKAKVQVTQYKLQSRVAEEESKHDFMHNQSKCTVCLVSGV